jgi:hypothetical protein
MRTEEKKVELRENDRPIAVHFDTEVEELEEKSAPGHNLNHNETFVMDRR